jgi:hypothetical protein
MRRSYARLAASCALAAATAIFAGAAVADPGHGNSANAPGQQKQEQAAQPQASQPTAQQSPQPAQHQAPGQVKKQTQSASSSSQPGVKPSSTTKHWTHTTVGASPDVSKRYGNGTTAAQIAHSRGAPDSQPLTGPGNSQPHKTFDCAHKNNPSGGVDVHAIKSYNTTCTAQVQTQQPQTNVIATHVCGQTTISTTSAKVVGVLHGKHQHLMTNTHSAHFTKHNDTPVVVQSTQIQVVPTSENCSAETPQVSQVRPVQTQQPSAPQQAVAPQQTQKSAAAPPAAPAAPAATGGVLGAQTSLASPKPASHHGVLGTVTHVAGSTLPFTGFPVWAAVLIALALISGGVLLRRRSASARV